MAAIPSPLQSSRPKFELKTFGRFALTRDGKTVDLGFGKPRGLIAYLASEQRPSSRERLAETFWARHFETQARQNLRKALSRIRAAIGNDALQMEGDYVSLNSQVIQADVAQFGSLIKSGSPDRLREAIALCDGLFLADLVIEESSWVTWLATRRQSLATDLVDALVRLGQYELEAGRADLALNLARRAVSTDSYREDGYRLTMSALLLQGRRSEALRIYDDLAGTLKLELGIDPDQETQLTASRIRRSQSEPSPPKPESATAAFKAELTLPDSPSIAVLPFQSGIGEASPEYFTDGLAEDLISALSRLRWLFVISRSSTFTYRGGGIDARRIGRELGVRYVLEGQVRVHGGRIRISTQLIDAQTGINIQSRRFERQFGELFALQDDLTEHIAASIEPDIRSNEIQRVRRKPAASLDAYDLYLRALHEIYKLNEQDYVRGISLLRNAIELDPDYAEALAVLADARGRQWMNGWVPVAEIALVKEEGLALAQRAAAADSGNGTVLATLAYAFAIMHGRFEEAMPLIERAPALQPSSDYVLALCGQVLVHAREGDRAITLFEKARRLNPVGPRAYVSLNGIAMAHFHQDRYEEAAHWARLAIAERGTWNVARRYRAAALAHLGRLDEARREILSLLQVQPDSSLSRSRTSHFRFESMYDQYIGGLRLAGLPD